MQTMPSFVYLIPVLMLFGLGKVPAIFATVIYAAPPLIRLTDLGIRQVDGEVMKRSTPSVPTAGSNCLACNFRWPCRASWPGSTRPP